MEIYETSKYILNYMQIFYIHNGPAKIIKSSFMHVRNNFPDSNVHNFPALKNITTVSYTVILPAKVILLYQYNIPVTNFSPENCTSIKHI